MVHLIAGYRPLLAGTFESQVRDDFSDSIYYVTVVEYLQGFPKTTDRKAEIITARKQLSLRNTATTHA